MDVSDSASLPYEEPSILIILVLSSFLILLNALNHVLDRIIYCGLIGQILLGIAWGTPGGRLLTNEAEHTIVNLGYLGLILLVFEGGLSTSFKSLKANIYLSIGVALTGISLPIALSYVLLKLADATPVQAFAAGAALCSTSLGTTFTVLGTSGLVSTRMGVVLSTAAMLDDVVGLVMVQVISNLGDTSSGEFGAITVIRPVFVSLAFAVLVPVLAWLIVRPATKWLNGWRETHGTSNVNRLIVSQHFALIMHTALLVAMVTGSSYAGTSNLFAAYLAGATISWWDSELPHPSPAVKVGHTPAAGDSNARTPSTDQINSETSGAHIFESFYAQPLKRILSPFFFASIGFSIPIAKLFNGAVVWRGFVYSLLMFIGKLACGLWLLRLPGISIPSLRLRKPRTTVAPTTSDTGGNDVQSGNKNAAASKEEQNNCDTIGVISTSGEATLGDPKTPRRSNESRKIHRRETDSTQRNLGSVSKPDSQPPSVRKPISIYPSLIVGCAMTARGEIGFLVSSLAQSNGVFNTASQSPGKDNQHSVSTIFLVVTWAIMICTIIGPICVGLFVRRVRALENNAKKQQHGSEKDVLGAWGVEQMTRASVH